MLGVVDTVVNRPIVHAILELIVSQKKQLQQGVVVDAVRGEVQGVREHMTSTTNHRGNLKEGIRIGFQRKKHLS